MPIDGRLEVVGRPVVESAVDPPIAWESSRAVGEPFAGGSCAASSCRPRGVTSGPTTGALRTSPNRPWRRWGTDRLVRMLLAVIADYRAANPTAARVGIADLSRPRGGPFGKRFGGLGHASHQNGLDADILYPRWTGSSGAIATRLRWSTRRSPRTSSTASSQPGRRTSSRARACT